MDCVRNVEGLTSHYCMNKLYFYYCINMKMFRWYVFALTQLLKVLFSWLLTWILLSISLFYQILNFDSPMCELIGLIVKHSELHFLYQMFKRDVFIPFLGHFFPTDQSFIHFCNVTKIKTLHTSCNT